MRNILSPLLFSIHHIDTFDLNKFVIKSFSTLKSSQSHGFLTSFDKA